MEAQSNRRRKYVAKSEPIWWDIAKWSIWSTDHITRSDQYDRQYCAREDDTSWCKPKGDDTRWY